MTGEMNVFTSDNSNALSMFGDKISQRGDTAVNNFAQLHSHNHRTSKHIFLSDVTGENNLGFEKIAGAGCKDTKHVCFRNPAAFLSQSDFCVLSPVQDELNLMYEEAICCMPQV